MTAFSGSFFEGPILESPHCTLTVHACAVLCQRMEQLVGGFLAREGQRRGERALGVNFFSVGFSLSLPEFCSGLARSRASLLEFVQVWLLISNLIWESL